MPHAKPVLVCCRTTGDMLPYTPLQVRAAVQHDVQVQLVGSVMAAGHADVAAGVPRRAWGPGGGLVADGRRVPYQGLELPRNNGGHKHARNEYTTREDP